MSKTRASIIQLLRVSTKSEHIALERAPLMASLLDKHLSLAGYTQVLLMFARFYATMDPLLNAATAECQGLPDRYRYEPRLPYLRDDLAALGERLDIPLVWQPVTLVELFSNRQDPSLLAAADTQCLTNEQTLGFIYVVEGSSQGGKILTPRLTKRLKLTSRCGLSFFNHFAFQATAWPALQAMLSALPENGALRQQDSAIAFAPNQVCDAACSLFQALSELTAQPQTVTA